MIWDTCTQRKPDVLGFEIMDVKKYDFFSPVVKVGVLAFSVVLDFSISTIYFFLLYLRIQLKL